MDDHEWLAERFEAQRPRLRAVAQRLLGSAGEADDAVQEAWLRLHRTDPDQVENLGGWLTTVVARVCLDMLRSRGARREQSLDAVAAPVVAARDRPGPEDQALVADAVGPAMLGGAGHPGPGRAGRLRAPRPVRGPLLRDRPAGGPVAGGTRMVRGAAAVASQALGFASRARSARPALVDGAPGLVVAQQGRPVLVLRFAFTGDLITRIEVLSGRGRLARLELAELDG